MRKCSAAVVVAMFGLFCCKISMRSRPDTNFNCVPSPSWTLEIIRYSFCTYMRQIDTPHANDGLSPNENGVDDADNIHRYDYNTQYTIVIIIYFPLFIQFCIRSRKSMLRFAIATVSPNRNLTETNKNLKKLFGAEKLFIIRKLPIVSSIHSIFYLPAVVCHAEKPEINCRVRPS